jgi:ABC-type lipoprotein export system ATPase subunit
MDVVMVIFFVEWIVLGLAGYYLDQVYATGSGVKRHPLFFLDCLLKRALRETQDAETPQQRDSATAVCGGRIPTFRLSGRASAAAAHELVDMRADAPDVQACSAAAYATPPESTAILARGLAKTYPGVDGAPPKMACRELSVAIPAGECFGLLGPNGAGKSTAINLLIGFLTPSRGEAFIQGCSLQADLDTVYSQLGVCPQHDLLWEQLSAREHLEFYGRLKSLSGPALTAACDEALRSVNLLTGGVGDRPCGTYSGGMKRRLSVAISLIGDPPVVFLGTCCLHACALRPALCL